MRRYCVKCCKAKAEFFDIIREIEDGFIIRLTRLYDGYEKIAEETMTRHLFDICLKTGYIYPVENEEAVELIQPIVA